MQIFSPELVVATLALASIYGLVALGLNLIYGTMRLLNVAHGEIMMIGAYLAYWLFTGWDVVPFWSMLLSVALTGVLGAVFYRTLFRALRKPAVAQRLEANSLLVFFALSVILQNIGIMVFSASPRSYNFLENVVTIGSVGIAANRLSIVLICIVVAMAVMAFFRYSSMGLAVRALIQQRDAAGLVGIDAEWINLFVFCLGFALAGLAGAMVSMTESFTPFSGFPYTLAAFFVVILGGLGSIGGGFVGALLLATIEVYGSALTSPAYRSILLYGVFILVLVLRPQGLFGRKMA